MSWDTTESSYVAVMIPNIVTQKPNPIHTLCPCALIEHYVCLFHTAHESRIELHACRSTRAARTTTRTRRFSPSLAGPERTSKMRNERVYSQSLPFAPW